MLRSHLWQQSGKPGTSNADHNISSVILRIDAGRFAYQKSLLENASKSRNTSRFRCVECRSDRFTAGDGQERPAFRPGPASATMAVSSGNGPAEPWCVVPGTARHALPYPFVYGHPVGYKDPKFAGARPHKASRDTRYRAASTQPVPAARRGASSVSSDGPCGPPPHLHN